MGRYLGVVCMVLLVVAACEDFAAPTGTPTDPGTVDGSFTLQKVGGDGQRGAPGAELPDPYRVKVVDEFGGAVPGVTVRFGIEDDAGGSLSASSVVSDSSGDAAVTARLPQAVDVTQTVMAESDSATNTVTFVSTTTSTFPGAANIRIISGDGQKGIVRDTLLDPLVVEVVNADGATLEGVRVHWQVASGTGGGAVLGTPTTTDAEGLSRNRWRLGDSPQATDRLIAFIEPENAAPDTVTFTARTTGTPREIVVTQGAVESGNNINQPDELVGDTVIAVPGHWARQPFKAIVVDAAGDSVRGAELGWTVTSRGGAVGDEPEGAGSDAVTAVTDEDGGITVWRKAPAESDLEQLAPECFDARGELRTDCWIGATLSIEPFPEVAPVTLDALVRKTSSSAGAARLRVASGDDQKGIADDTLLDRPVVEVVDREGAPLEGVVVAWEVTSADGGSALAASTTTGADGKSANRWRLGDSPQAVDLLTAVIDPAEASPDTVVFTARVTGPPSQVVVTRGAVESGNNVNQPDQLFGDTVIAVPGHWARQAFTATAVDAAGDPVRGAAFTWTVASRGGAVGLAPEGAGAESVGLVTGEDGGITVWRKAATESELQQLAPECFDAEGTLQEGCWIGATLSEERADGVAPVTLDALVRKTSSTAGAARIRVVSGDDQKGITRDTLLDRLVVEVTDGDGVALEGVSVRWKVLSADGGAVLGTPTTTDAGGLSENRWRLGDLPQAVDSLMAFIEPGDAAPDTVVFTARVTGPPDEIVVTQGAIETDNDFNEPESVVGDTVFVAPDHWARKAFKGIVVDAAGDSVRGAELSWTVTSRGGAVGDEPEGEGTLAVTVVTDEDGGITVWRKAGSLGDLPQACFDAGGDLTDDCWIGATLSIERFPEVDPVTLDALLRE